MQKRTEQEIMRNWKTDDKPLVSISCITYNHENYIAEAIESFLMQETNFPFEVLVHDDCSTDNTANIIREYEKKYPNIIKPIYQKENQYSKGVKVGPTFNYPRAKGEYIALCEGDDYWTDPLKLQKQVDFLEENADVVMVFHNAKIYVYNNGIVTEEKRMNKGVNTGIIEPKAILRKWIVPTASVLFRNNHMDAITSFMKNKELIVGDSPLFLFLAQFGTIYYDNTLMSIYRQLPTGIVQSLLSSIDSKLALVEHYRFINKYFKNFGLSHITKKHIAYCYYSVAIKFYRKKNYSTAFKYSFLSLINHPFYILSVFTKFSKTNNQV